MEVEIKNTTGDYLNCVLFSLYDSCFKAITSEKSFFNLKTDDGVVISIDGDSSDEKRKSFIQSLATKLFRFKYIEFSESTDELGNFTVMNTDANGDIFFRKIHTSMHIDASCKSTYPLKIYNDFNEVISIQTSYLFKLKPNQEVILKFIQ
jgi:hypothetical protein